MEEMDQRVSEKEKENEIERDREREGVDILLVFT